MDKKSFKKWLYTFFSTKVSDGYTTETWSELAEDPLRKEEMYRLALFLEQEQQVDKTAMWQSIEQGCLRQKRKKRLQWMGYAAGLLLLVAAGAAVLQLSRDQEEEAVQLVNIPRINPESDRVVLWIDKNQFFELPHSLKDTLFEVGGIKVQVDSNGMVSYMPAEELITEEPLHRISVPRAGEYSFYLSDGTRVYLNSESQLDFPVQFAGNERRVTVKGEAFFDVVADPSRPFIVEADTVEIQVLGTQFNVNTYLPHQVVTTLLTGSVRMSNPKRNQELVLKPNQQGEYRNGIFSVKTVNAENTVAWMQGKFYFEAQPLEVITACLERWYDVHFVFQDEALRHQQFTGVIDKNYTAEQLLEIIQKTTHLRFEHREQIIFIDK